MYSKILVRIGSPAASQVCRFAGALRGKTKLIHVENERFTDYTLAPPLDDDRVFQAVRIKA